MREKSRASAGWMCEVQYEQPGGGFTCLALLILQHPLALYVTCHQEAESHKNHQLMQKQHVRACACACA